MPLLRSLSSVIKYSILSSQWYENTLLSRLDDEVRGAIVLVMQRLHLGDLAGHLL
jgi:hypothetical protein